jgi:hypothetical protein
VTWPLSDPELLLSQKNRGIGVLIGRDVTWAKTLSWFMSVWLLLVLVSLLSCEDLVGVTIQHRFNIIVEWPLRPRVERVRAKPFADS